MFMQIRKIIIWPKNSEFSPREVTFELNKVNVITGASRTGKSAIIPIIDYCLGSMSCSIPIDTIRDHAAWYGVLLKLSDQEILIARRVPEGNKSSLDFYYSQAKTVSIPPSIDERNCSLDTVKQNLNELALLPFFGLEDNEESPSGFKYRLSFRDLMAFVFQTQDIVANQNILFYKTHAHEHREKLRTWFPFILGAETLEILKARYRLQVIDKRLSRLIKEREKERSISDQWKSNIYGHLRTAVEYGLILDDFSETDSPEILLEIGKSLIERNPDKPAVTSESVNDANRQILELELKDNELARELATIKQRLDEVKKLRDGFTGFGTVAKKRTNRLQISRWLADIAADSPACPVCGEDGHASSLTEMERISHVLSMYEDSASKFTEIPTTFDREEERLKEELEELIDKRKSNSERHDWLISKDKEARSAFYKNKEMYIFLGHFKASLERFEKLFEGGDLEEEIRVLQEEYEALKPLVSESAIQKRVEVATQDVAQTMLTYLQDLDVEEKYRQRRPEVNIRELAIRVMGNEGDWHFLAEVGSASNWVAFHIAAMCSFQEYFASLFHSSVPSFVVFDQPSQVYFPKVRNSASDTERVDHRKFQDEDLEAVRKIFSALSMSISKNDASWQFIVLDHADADVYGGIENIHEVEVWRDGKKLIPEEWYM